MFGEEGIGGKTNHLIRDFATRFAPNANSIALKQDEVSVESIKQFYMDCKNEDHKAETLCNIYGLLTIGQSIIFVRVSCSSFTYILIKMS